MKLNLGCGDQLLDDFINVDCRNLPGVIIDDIVYLSTFKDNTVEMIYAAHCLLTIFPRIKVYEALKNWYRVLKPDGQIIIEVANIMPMLLKFIANEIPIESFIQGTYGVDEDGMRTFTCFDFEYLKKLLENTGFKDVKEIHQPDYSKHCIETNLAVEAIK